MSFDPGSQLDPSQIQDRRGGVSGRTVALGGGGLGIVGVILTLVLTLAGGGGSTTDILNQLSGLNGQQVGDSGSSGTVASETVCVAWRPLATCRCGRMWICA